MDDLFTYGTLMCEDIMTSVAGMKLESTRGVLKGYRRMEVKDEHYPAIIEDDKGEVDGVVYLGLPRSSIEQLDIFEGEIYTRTLVEIQLGDGNTIKAWAYVLKERYYGLLGLKEWSFEEFLKSGKSAFVSNYSGFFDVA